MTSRQKAIRAKLETLVALDTIEYDPESAHAAADDLLLDALDLAGYPEFREAFAKIEKGYA